MGDHTEALPTAHGFQEHWGYLYRLGAITINGVMPQRVSAAKLVELCNDGETATIVWLPKTGG